MFVTHWNVRAQPELGLECAAEGGRLAKGQPMYGLRLYYARARRGIGAERLVKTTCISLVV